MNIDIPVTINGHVKIQNADTGEILLDKDNAIHPQNMSRIIARALAHSPNSWIYKICYGNGGTFVDAAGNIVFNTPNVGQDGNWASSLYSQTYAEIVDLSSNLVGVDPGSSDVDNTRPGGGSDPADDPAGDGVTSQEVGLKSNVIVTDYINPNEPSGQALTSSATFTVAQDCFVFDEIGLYSPGLPQKATNGYTTVNVGNMTSTDNINLPVNTVLTLTVTIDGTLYSFSITTPLTGSGLSGQLTFGDFCEGLNTGSWVSGGGSLNTLMYVYITDNSEGTYPSILNAQSYGFLTFQSKTSGTNSRVLLSCNSSSGTDLMNILTSGTCTNCNTDVVQGQNAGVQNDPINPQNEGERLLAHLIFAPVNKAADVTLVITYTLTISVAPTQDSQTNITTS